MNVNITPQKISVSVNQTTAEISVGNPIVREYIGSDPYTGTYTVTPTIETQTLLTKNLRMTEDLVINPIPNNYGLITWNGAFITVS